MSDTKILTRLMFTLLPVQIMLAGIGSVNGIVSSYFATNYVGTNAMSAIGLYGPFGMFMGAVSTMLMGGSAIISSRYLGMNRHDKVQNIFSLNLILGTVISVFFMATLFIIGRLDLTGAFTSDPEVREIFNIYLIGQSIGAVPLLLGSQLPAFLALENRGRRTTAASIVYIIVNIILNYIFVEVMHLEALGLALASSLGLWIFFLVQLQYFLSRASMLKIRFKSVNWKEAGSVFRIGLPGALSNGYQTIRILAVNKLVETTVGAVGISAFTAANNFLAIFWAIPVGMINVSRLLIGVSVGEEDRKTLTDIMRVMFKRFVPLMSVICLAITLLAVPCTRIFFHDPSDPVYMMTVWGIRLLPACLPLAIVLMHFVCYGQASDKNGFIHVTSILDGAVCVIAFTAVFIRMWGINSVYLANIFNGVVGVLAVIIYACIKNKKFPRNMEELMVIPEYFGAREEDRIDITITDMTQVVNLSSNIYSFCRNRGIDYKRSYFSALAMEEMAGNIVRHGFSKDKKKHRIDGRVTIKDNKVILRLKDNCVPFDPSERESMMNNDDKTRNIGIKLVFRTAEDVEYQNLFGLNALTIKL